MTAPIEEEEVVVSLRLQPVVARPGGWRGWSSSLVAAGLVGFVAVGIALGTVFDGGVPAQPAPAVGPLAAPAVSPAATRRLIPTPRPQLPPLPTVQVIGGEIPTERRLVYANGLQVLDLATGELTTPGRPYEDIVLSLGEPEVVCICVIRQPPVGDAMSSSVVLRFERLATSGVSILERELATIDGIVEVPGVGPGFVMAAILTNDDRSLFVLTAARRPPIWNLELHQVDTATGELIGTTVLGELATDPGQPQPSPSAESPSAQPYGGTPDGLYVWANSLTMSPDGTLLAVTIVYSEVRADEWTNKNRELLVPLTSGRPGTATAIETHAEVRPNEWCIGPPEFVDNDLIVQVCTAPDGPRGGGSLFVRRVTTAGTSIGDLALQATPTEDYYQLAIALDRARRAIVAWNPVLHSMSRVSLDDGAVIARELARAMVPEAAPSNSRGYIGTDPGLVLSPDGQRLFAIGIGPGPGDGGTPTGVWVFDAESLNLIDHWPPRAMLTSLGVSVDGRFVYAAGANGFDVEGNQASWPASVTVYDALTGEIQVIYGAVTGDGWLSFRPLP